MATTYRITRNIEASFIDFITFSVNTDWSGINVEKTFARVYDLELPTICVRDVFCKSDGQRLDLKDYLIEKLKGGIVYYDYIIANGAIQTKTANGRIRVMSIDDTPVDFDMDKDKLDVHDRYRHLLSLTISLGRIEI